MSDGPRIFQSFDPIKGFDPGANWLLGPGLTALAANAGNDPILPLLVHSKGPPTRLFEELELEPEERERGDPERRERGDIVPVAQAPKDPDESFLFVALARLGTLKELAARNARILAERSGHREGHKESDVCLRLGLPLPAETVHCRPGEQDKACPEPPPHGVHCPPDENKLPLCPPLPPIRPDEWPSDTVVVGIIDDGIAFANDRFRHQDGTTRFAYLWRQDDTPGDRPTVCFGRELAGSEINCIFDQSKCGDFLDEDRVYRLSRFADFTTEGHKSVSRRIAHGSHVLDLASGYDRATAPITRPLIGVQLPVAATASESGAGLEPYVICALHYILERAKLLTRPGEKPLPVVINFSYGTYAGPHNGHSLLERAIDRFSKHHANPHNKRGPLRVVLPAGNSNLARCHAELCFKGPGEKHELHVRVQPDGQATNTIQLWLPRREKVSTPKARVKLKLVTPDGTESCTIYESEERQCTLEQCRSGTVECTQFLLPTQVPLPDPASHPQYASGHYSFDTCVGLGVFRIDIGPTTHIAALDGCQPPLLAPAGLWTIVVENISLGPRDPPIQAWIERNDLLFGYPRVGRQAYFDEECYVRYAHSGHNYNNPQCYGGYVPPGAPITEDCEQPDCTVKRIGMINGIATGNEPIVMGGFVGKDYTVANYSAGGYSLEPSVTRGPVRPDAVAVTDDSRVHQGVIAAGSHSGSNVPLRGTSMAAPQVTRWVADLLGSGLAPDWQTVRILAHQAETTRPAWAPPLPPVRGGYGRNEFRPPPPPWRRRYWR